MSSRDTLCPIRVKTIVDPNPRKFIAVSMSYGQTIDERDVAITFRVSSVATF